MLIVGREELVDWSRFGAVVPLFTVGLVASAWRPLAERIAPRLRRGVPAAEPPAADASPAPIDPFRVRPTAVLNAVAAGLLLVSLVAFRTDPLPIQLGMPLPTYLGVRTSVEDLRTRQILQRALAAMETYRSLHGSYQGFDPATGADADPALAWSSGVPAATEGNHVPYLTMGIVTASRSTARVAAVSQSGNAYCIQHSPGGVTYGEGSGDQGRSLSDALQLAVAACGSLPWTSAAVRPFPVDTLCEGRDPDGGYLLCRMVQVVLTETMQQTGPR
jgi:hypothetical protein